MTRGKVVLAGIAGAIVLIAWVGSGSFQIVSATPVPPTHVPPEGGSLSIDYVAVGIKACAHDVEVAIMKDEAVDIVVWRHRGVATHVSASWRAKVRIPPLPPGSYFYLTTFIANCLDKLHRAVAPKIKFEVRP